MSQNPAEERHRWLVLGLLMAGTLMAALDTSIVNVALPNIMSAFGVNRDQIEWVSTAFMLASAVTMPLIGYVSDRFSYERLYIIALFIFTLASGLCAAAWSYHALIFARILQAIGGGAVRPMSMAMVTELFEPHERGKALGIWGTGIMIGPAIGPTLGGYLTDWFSWRTIFSVNLPIGVLTLIACTFILDLSPANKRTKRSFDVMGYGFLAMFLISTLLCLANGEREGWTSMYVLTSVALSVVGLVMFIATELAVEHPLLDLGLFRYRNYSVSLVLAAVRSMGLFGGIFLLPIFLQNIMGYTTTQTGLWLMPGAIMVGICMPVAGHLTDKFHARWLVAAGSAITGISLVMFGNLDPMTGALGIIGPQLVRGVGLALLMSPLMTAALNSVPNEVVPTASSFMNVASRVGGSFGIAILNTYVSHSAKVHMVRLGALMPMASHRFHRSAQWIAEHLGAGQGRATMLLAKAMAFNAQVLSFDNGFVVAGLILIVLGAPLGLLLTPTGGDEGASGEPAVAD